MSGRPNSLSALRQLLILGTMGSGTTATAQALSKLGVEVAHESSDSLVNLCRDGTVSWAHALRYLVIAADRRESTVSHLCSNARHGAFHHLMFDGGALGGGFGCTARGTMWDSCWENECLRVMRRELGCAALSPSNCTTPFTRALLGVRHPLRTIESNIVSFCRGGDDSSEAAMSIQLDTYNVLMPPPPRPAHANATASSRRTDRTFTGDGECARQFGWWWVRYIRLVRPVAFATYRVEDTPPCAILKLGGVLPADSAAPPASAVPPSTVELARAKCAAAAVGGRPRRGTAAHGSVNHRNGAHGHAPLRITFRSLRAVDAQLAAAVSDLARELGYAHVDR